MDLLLVGISHVSAPVELREKVAFTPEQIPGALKDCIKSVGLRETAILSTCNRTEVIAFGEQNEGMSDIVSWLADYHRLDAADLTPSIYVKTGAQVAHHAVRVASGLDSMVVGESQILGQFKECFESGRSLGTVGPELDHLAQTAFRIAKKVRTETAIGENSVSFASIAATLAQRYFNDLGNCRVLLVGAGDTSELVARHMRSAGAQQITVANRTLGNAVELANQVGGDAIDLQSLSSHLQQTDIVVASTAAQLPILGKGMAERAMKARQGKSMLMVDLAVPRDIEPEVAEVENIHLYSVDDLQAIIDSNLYSRAEAAQDAEVIIDCALANFLTAGQVRKANETMVRFRDFHHRLKESELTKAHAKLANGETPEDVLVALANRLVNKMIHSPSVALRNASEKGDQPIIDAIERIFPLDDD